MTLIDFLGSPQVQPFSVAGAVVLLLLLLELAGLLLGGSSVGAALDDWLGLDHDTAIGHEAASAGPVAGALAWLNFGRLPTLVALILLFGAFAVCGLGLQALALKVGGALASGWLMALPAAIGGGLLAHAAGGLVARIVPREESYAILPEQLVGRVARVEIGPVDETTPGRATVTDGNGNRHNVRVLAHGAGARFENGTPVLLASRRAQIFLVTAVPSGLAAPPPPSTPPEARP